MVIIAHRTDDPAALALALRACMAALQQVSLALEEAAESLGATKSRTIRRVVVPLMTGASLPALSPAFNRGGGTVGHDHAGPSEADSPLAYGGPSTCSCRRLRGAARVRRWHRRGRHVAAGMFLPRKRSSSATRN